MKSTKMFWSTITVLVLCIFMLLPMGSVFAQKDGGMIVYPLTSEPRPFDPHHLFGTKNTDNLLQHLYENLVFIDKDLNYVPALATSWKMAADGKSCVFNLRKGVKFHDGAPFNAKAVQANFDRISKERLNGWKFVGAWYKSMDIIDDYTVRFNLKDIYTPFMSEMAQYYTRLISPEAIKKYGMELGKHPAGTGPWMFSKWTPGEEIIFVANPDYWGGKPHLDGIKFRITPDMTSRMLAFESRSFDLLNQPQYVDIERLEKTGKYNSKSQITSELFHLAFNVQLEPFDQKEVRHAINYAINKTAIVKSLLGEKVLVANSFVPPHFPDSVIKEDAYAYNPEKAKSILKDLGWKPGSDGILVKDGKRFEFKIMTPNGRYPMDKQICEAIQGSLRKIGIKTELEVVEIGGFIQFLDMKCEDKRNSKIGMVARTRPMGASYEFAFIQHYHGDSNAVDNNVACFSNKDFDKYIISARTIVDEKERGKAHAKAQEVLFEEMPSLPIFFYRLHLFSWKYVHELGLFPPAYTPTPFVTHETWMDK